MEQKKYSIAEKTFVFNLSLRADELIAPIKKAMLKDMFDALSSSAEKILNVQTAVNDPTIADKADSKLEKNQKDIISVVIDQARINNWFYETGNAHRLCAVLLIEEGKKLSEVDLQAQEEFMADNATQEIASEVITHFFTRCGSFGIPTPKSFTKN